MFVRLFDSKATPTKKGCSALSASHSFLFNKFIAWFDSMALRSHLPCVSFALLSLKCAFGPLHSLRKIFSSSLCLNLVDHVRKYAFAYQFTRGDWNKWLLASFKWSERRNLSLKKRKSNENENIFSLFPPVINFILNIFGSWSRIKREKTSFFRRHFYLVDWQ